MQLDEKWAFVGKKQARCDPQQLPDHHAGDCWDHVAFDPEHRLVLGMISGKRSATRILQLLQQVRQQLQGRIPRLITSDEFSAYPTVLPLVWPQPPKPQRDRRCTRHRRRKKPPPARPHAALCYATLCKHRRQGRVVKVQSKVVYGSKAAVARALKQSRCSTAINTRFLERHNATDRHRNARKRRRTYCFSKDWAVHEAVGQFTYYSYNFCWCVRSLRKRAGRGRWSPRTAAMSAGLTDHRWSLQEWLEYPVTGLSS